MPIPDVTFRAATSDIAFGFFTGAQLFPAKPPGTMAGDLLIAHIWSYGTAPGPGPGAFRQVPAGWTYLPGSYLPNIGLSPPSACWIFFKIATGSEPSNGWQWLLPRPTINIWTIVVYGFFNADQNNFFNGFQTAVDRNGSPLAAGLTPDWRNDVSLLLFAQVVPPGFAAWPPTPNAPAGYTLLTGPPGGLNNTGVPIENQGAFQVGYIGVPNSCNPVPDVFLYTEAQQITAFGRVLYTDSWMAYSFLLKNVNVAGMSCAGPGPPPVCDSIS